MQSRSRSNNKRPREIFEDNNRPSASTSVVYTGKQSHRQAYQRASMLNNKSRVHAFDHESSSSNSYMAKKEEFRARLIEGSGSGSGPRPDSGPGSGPGLVSRKNVIRVCEPVCESEEEEASRVLQAMEHGFGLGMRYGSGNGSRFTQPVNDSESGSSLKSPKVEPSETMSGSTTTNTTTSGEDSREEGNKPPWMDLGLDMLLIDNHGKLLGQFSRLDDDLRICG